MMVFALFYSEIFGMNSGRVDEECGSTGMLNTIKNTGKDSFINASATAIKFLEIYFKKSKKLCVPSLAALFVISRKNIINALVGRCENTTLFLAWE